MSESKYHRLTQQQLVDLILSEYTYWRDADDDPPDDNLAREQQLVDIQIGAMAACSNILCAVLGNPAKWHKAPPQQPPLQTSLNK